MISSPSPGFRPVGPADLAAGQVRLSEGFTDQATHYWLRSDPADAGRTTLLRRDPAGQVTDVTPDWDVRTAIHAYGGTPCAIRAGRIAFYDRRSGRVWTLGPAGPARPITPAGPWSFGGFTFAGDNRVVAVREDSSPGLPEPRDTLVVLDLDADNPDGGVIVAEGADFYFSPAVSATGWLAWMEDDHPSMPWGTTRILAKAPDGTRHVVFAEPGVAAVYPAWDDDGSLVFLTDRSGYSNFYRWANGGITRLHDHDYDFCNVASSLAPPPYALLGGPDPAIGCFWWRDGLARLGRLSLRDGTLAEIGAYGSVWLGPAEAGISVVGLGPLTQPQSLNTLDWATGEITELATEGIAPLPDWAVSRPELVTWPGTEPGESVVGWFYAPVVPADTGAPPPLLVRCHGGPVGYATAAFSLLVQFFTSHGIAVLDVNYSGSSAMGRAYRDRLLGRWGVADSDEATAGARHLAERGLVDATRCAIMGGSAGGLTVLNALAGSDVFGAGIALYAVADLAGLARDTTKFESHYTFGLVGPYPEADAVYRERSPLFHAGAIRSPLLILQGADDPVVPPGQAYDMLAAMRAAGGDAELVVYEGESHGFRQASTIEDAHERILAFLERVWGLRLG